MNVKLLKILLDYEVKLSGVVYLHKKYFRCGQYCHNDNKNNHFLVLNNVLSEIGD